MTGLVPRGALMVCGTASNSGKSVLVAGLCRLFARRGAAVAPFKGQNMALNSYVTANGEEIGRAQAAQAAAAGIEPEAVMNPVLLKPTSDRHSQVVVLGRPWRTLGAVAFHDAKEELVPIVDQALAELRGRFDVVVCEGAGSPAEINLLRHDLVNLGLASRAAVPAILIGDIDRGGVFAHLYGTTTLLPDGLRAALHGFVINKFRGDPALLGDATTTLAQRTGLPTLGVVPWLEDVAIDAEDSLSMQDGSSYAVAIEADAAIDVAVVRFPRISNFTDVDALSLEPNVSLRWVRSPGQLRGADLIVLPGTKSTIDDLGWLRRRGLEAALRTLVQGPGSPVVLGLCGGYQMLGGDIQDDLGVEHAGGGHGLGLLDVTTAFGVEKVLARRVGVDPRSSVPIDGYEIHHGAMRVGATAAAWFALDGPVGLVDEGVADEARGLYGTSLHGLLEGDEFRSRFLATVAARRERPWRPSGVSFAAARDAQFERVADALEEHIDVDALLGIVAEGALR
jgi:adenosylcobyric acid synthase